MADTGTSLLHLILLSTCFTGAFSLTEVWGDGPSAIQARLNTTAPNDVPDLRSNITATLHALKRFRSSQMQLLLEEVRSLRVGLNRQVKWKQGAMEPKLRLSERSLTTDRTDNNMPPMLPPPSTYVIPIKNVMGDRIQRMISTCQWMCSDQLLQVMPLVAEFSLDQDWKLNDCTRRIRDEEDVLKFLKALDSAISNLLTPIIDEKKLMHIRGNLTVDKLPEHEAVKAEDPIDALVIWIKRSTEEMEDIVYGKFQLSFPDLYDTGKVAESSFIAMRDQIEQLENNLPKLRHRLEGKIEPSLTFIGNVSSSLQQELGYIKEFLSGDLFPLWFSNLKIIFACVIAVLVLTILQCGCACFKRKKSGKSILPCCGQRRSEEDADEGGMKL